MEKLVNVQRIGPKELRVELADMERDQGMSSAAFLERWVNGELDGDEFTYWAGLCRMAIRCGLLEPPSTVSSAFPVPGASPDITRVQS